jgi:hypothetical protein
MFGNMIKSQPITYQDNVVMFKEVTSPSVFAFKRSPLFLLLHCAMCAILSMLTQTQLLPAVFERPRPCFASSITVSNGIVDKPTAVLPDLPPSPLTQ